MQGFQSLFHAKKAAMARLFDSFSFNEEKQQTVMVSLWAFPLKGINWQPQATHPVCYTACYILYFSFSHSRSGHIVFLHRVVFLPPTLPVSVFLRDRVGGREVYFF